MARVLGIVWDSETKSFSLWLDTDWPFESAAALHIDGMQLLLKDAEYLPGRHSTDRLRWSLADFDATSLDLTPGDTVHLRLEGPAALPPLKTDTPSVVPLDPPPPSYDPPPPSYDPPPPSYDPPR